jgi:hypothetical protein
MRTGNTSSNLSVFGVVFSFMVASLCEKIVLLFILKLIKSRMSLGEESAALCANRGCFTLLFSVSTLARVQKLQRSYFTACCDFYTYRGSRRYLFYFAMSDSPDGGLRKVCSASKRTAGYFVFT